MKKKVAIIVQPCFFPWRGYFDLISKGDVWVIFDDVQYVRRSWYNRNLIYSNGDARWITVPVHSKGNYNTEIKDILINNDDDWRGKILKQISYAYRDHPFYEKYYTEFSNIINGAHEYISEIAIESVQWGMKCLGMHREIVKSSEIEIPACEKVEKLIRLCKAVGANHYISGPAAKGYIKSSRDFEKAGIGLEWMEYKYEPYPQKNTFREKPLSIIDLLFNVGEQAVEYIK